MTNRLFGTAKLLSGVFKASILSFIAIFAFAIYDFVLPLFVEGESDNFAIVGIIISLVYVASLLSEVPIGLAVDRYGRIRMLITAMSALGALGILYFFSNGAIQLAVLSLLAGVISVAFWVPSTVLVRDFSPRKMLAQSEGVYLTITQLGWIAGPMIAGIVSTQFSDKHNFLIFTFLMFTAVGAAFLIFRGKDVKRFRKMEKEHEHQSRIKLLMLSFVKYMKLHKHATPLYALSLIAYMWISLEWAFIALTGIKTFGFSETVVGVLVGAMMAIEGMLYLTSGYLMDKVGTKYIITSGFFLLFASSYFIFLAQTPAAFLFAVLMAAGATSWILPGTESLLTKIVPANMMGEMTSVFDTSKDFGLIIGPLVGGLIANQFGNPQAAFGMIFVSAGAACLFSGYIFWPDKSYKKGRTAATTN
ncbi:MAG: MFS transporter [archaeon]